MSQSPIDPDKRYQTLRKHGVPQYQAAALANTRPAPAPRPADEDLAHWSRAELERHAAEIGIDQVSSRSRADLIRILREHPAGPVGEP